MEHDVVEAYRLLIADVYELAGESRRSSEALARRLQQTAARWHALSVLADGPRTVAGAARRLGLSRQSVQRVIDDLAVAGQVELRPNPDHARAPLVALTPAGRQTLTALSRCSARDRRTMLTMAGVSAEDLNIARAVLSHLVAAVRNP